MNAELYHIKKRIDSYMGFDSDLIFKSARLKDEVRIFGGCIRDSIANFEINDIDILTSPINKKGLHYFLLSNGYVKVNKLMNKHFGQIYSNVGIISEPHTYINSDFKIIQLITPLRNNANISYREGLYINSYADIIVDLIKNVDISCCGLSYDGNMLIENYPNAYIHAVQRVFSVNEKAKMFSSERCDERVNKLEMRGWESIKYSKEIKKRIDREVSFEYLLGNNFLKKEYSNNETLFTKNI